MAARTVAVYLHRAADDAWEVLLLRRKLERGPHRWVAAGGVVEHGESVEEAARREVFEETGRDIGSTVFSLECGYRFERDGRVFEERAFAAVAPAGWEPTLDRAEHDGYAWFALPAAAEKIAWPENRVALDALARLL
ncbi:MAG: NUDIX domain-containing protein [Gaiellaceae bacterium]